MAGGDPATSPPLTPDEVDSWYESLRRDPLQWVIEAEGRCIGTARLRHVDVGNRSATYAIGIFHPRFWSRGYGTEATLAVLGHAFGKMGLHRVALRVLEFNRRAIACYEKCGFVREGIQRDGVRIGGEWLSEVLMAILDHEYRMVRSEKF